MAPRLGRAAAAAQVLRGRQALYLVTVALEQHLLLLGRLSPSQVAVVAVEELREQRGRAVLVAAVRVLQVAQALLQP